MEITLRHIILIFVSVFLFLYLTDTFKSPEFNNTMKSFLQNKTTNSTSHSFLYYMENKSNTLAGFIAITAVTILNQFPV